MTMGGGEIQATKDRLWLDGYEVLGLGKMKGSDWWGINLMPSNGKEEATNWPKAPGSKPGPGT